MVLFLNKKKLQEQKPLVNNTYWDTLNNIVKENWAGDFLDKYKEPEKKPKQVFKIGEGLNEEAAQKAHEIVRQPAIPEAKIDYPSAQKNVKDLLNKFTAREEAVPVRRAFEKEPVMTKAPPIVTSLGQLGFSLLEAIPRAVATFYGEVSAPERKTGEVDIGINAKRLGYENEKYRTAAKEFKDKVEAGENPWIAGLNVVSNKTLDVAFGAQLLSSISRFITRKLTSGAIDRKLAKETVDAFKKNQKQLFESTKNLPLLEREKALADLTNARDVAERILIEKGLPTTLDKARIGASKYTDVLARETSIGGDFWSRFAQPDMNIKPTELAPSPIAGLLPGERAKPGQAPNIGLSLQEVEGVGKPTTNRLLTEEAEILRGTKGMTADDIMATYPNIKLKRDIPATTIDGVKTTIKEGEKLTPYELKGNKILLQDGKTYIVSKNQFQNIKGQSVLAEGKPFAPELEGLEESIKSAETKKKIPEGYGEKPLEQYKAELKRQMPKYENYTIPGGENYREILIKAPDTRKTVGVEKIESIYDLQDYFSKKMFNEDKLYKLSSYQKQQVFDNPEYSKLHDKLKENKVVNIRVDITDEGIKSQEGAFKSSHWDEPNVISHIRMNERTYNGKKVAFMEELQSDWAREGRDKGFVKEITKETAKEQGFTVTKSETSNGDEAYFIDNPTDEYFYRKGFTNTGFDTEIEAWNGIISNLKISSNAVPYNPLLKNWQELSIKRALKDAVDNNSDYFAWINGEQTSARYNLATYLDNAKWNTGKTDVKKIELKPKTGNDIVLAIDKKGEILTSSQNEMIGKKLDEVLGKGLADKIMAKESGTLSGEGLKFGGEWASNLYDRQVKNIVEKLTGQKVEMLDMGLPVEKSDKTWSILDSKGIVGRGLTPQDLKVGTNITTHPFGIATPTDSYVITDVLGDGKFKATPKSEWNKKIRTTPSETFDISEKKSVAQMGIKLTPEVKNKIKGIAPKIKTSGKMFEEKPQTSIPETGNVLKIIQNTPETTTKKILTSAKETPIEFGLGKGVIQEKIISNESSKLNDLLNRAKITKEESLELFNAFDNPQKYKLSQSLINKNGDDIIKEGRRLNSFLSEQKLSRGVIDRVYDDETYLRTVLETLDGKKPTAEQVARLRNATNQTFRDQLARDLTGFSGKLREKIKTDIRKYRTADERDVILESFGLRTKRDFVNSMSENIRLTTRATSNKEFNDAVRSIAKDGFWVKGKKLVKRDDIIEAYDPFVVSKTRQEIKNNTSKKISKIIDKIKEERMLTENEAKIIKDIIYEQKEEAIKELKDSHKYALDDIDNIINFTKQQIARVKNTLLDEKAILLERKTKLIENIRDEAKKELNDFYGKITIKRGELIDKGFKDAGSISGAEPLRGVMLNKKDYRALKEFVEELGESSLEDFAKTIKYFQATLDLFQIPQLLRSSISSSGFIKGCWDWLKAVVKSSGVSVGDMVKSSEFVQQGRFKDFDIDIWNKQLKDMNDNTSWFMKQFKKLEKKTDNIPIVRDVLNGIGAIDEYQFQTVMIPLKTKAWLRKVDELKRLYPNLDERSIMVEAGRFIDDYFGGQQWDKLMARNPRLASRQNQRISRIMIFATDYLTSTMRKFKRETLDAFTKWGVPEGNMARKALAREIIFGLGLVNVISYMTRGKSTFENDDPNQFYKLQTNIMDESGNPYYLDIMGNWGQTWNLINRPIDAIRGKISGIGKIGVSLLADGELKIGEALNPIPFSWRSILETAYNHALGRKPGTQIPETIGGGALITLMEFMGLSGTFSGGKSRRQTLMRMIEAESFTLEEVWKYLTGQNVFTNKERITRMIEKDGISDAYSWELEQKKKGYLSEESYPTRDALKTKYGITGSITNDENILRINRMTKEEQRIFIKGYSEKTQELIKDKIKTGSYKKSLSDIFK